MRKSIIKMICLLIIALSFFSFLFFFISYKQMSNIEVVCKEKGIVIDNVNLSHDSKKLKFRITKKDVNFDDEFLYIKIMNGDERLFDKLVSLKSLSSYLDFEFEVNLKKVHNQKYKVIFKTYSGKPTTNTFPMTG